MQTVVLVSLVLLTAVLVAVGVWLILVLNEVRQVLRRVNKTTQAFESLVNKLESSSATVGGLVEGVSQGIKLVELIQGLIRKKKHEKRDNS